MDNSLIAILAYFLLLAFVLCIAIRGLCRPIRIIVEQPKEKTDADKD